MHRQSDAGTGPAKTAARSRSADLPRRRIGPAAVGSYVPRLARAAFERFGFASATLITDWETIVGSELAAKAEPERIRWPKPVARGADDAIEAAGIQRAATIVLSVDPIHALHIEYARAQIIERINAYFGYRAVSELRIEQRPARTLRRAAAPQSPSAQPAPPRQTIAIEDDRLRTALERLSEGIASRRLGRT